MVSACKLAAVAADIVVVGIVVVGIVVADTVAAVVGTHSVEIEPTEKELQSVPAWLEWHSPYE